LEKENEESWSLEDLRLLIDELNENIVYVNNKIKE
jgi:hypothetical protein